MIKFSFGPSGEFFMESSEALTAEEVDLAELLYKRIMNARSECDIINDARRGMYGDED